MRPKHPPVGDRKLSKRPLHHPPIPSPFSASPKHVYITHRTPFISAVKRIRKLLAHIDARHSQRIVSQTKAVRGDRILAAARALENRSADAGADAEVIIVKGAGRAIPKVLSLAAWFGEKGEERGRVELHTKSVSAIDDILDEDGDEETRVRGVSVLELHIRPA
jgi:ribonuclease P/MRP protein subunit POP7